MSTAKNDLEALNARLEAARQGVNSHNSLSARMAMKQEQKAHACMTTLAAKNIHRARA